MKSRRKTLLFCTIAALWLSVVSTSTAADPLGDAAAAYTSAQTSTDRDTRNREFARAALLFEQAADATTATADLWTNAGNARLQSQSIGRAILAYRRALAADPRHARAQQNLAQARSLLPSWVPRKPSAGVLDTFFFWHRTLSRNDRAAIGALSFLLACGCIGIAVGWRRNSLRGVAVVPLLVWLAAMGSLLVEASDGSALPAVVVVDETIARASDSINAAQRFSAALPAGTEVEILEERPRFSHIRLANDRDGWIPRSSYELVDG
jgi:tetratricopeptide (TPR) repeat protein